MAEPYFILRHPSHRWGDYGDVLVHGYGGIDEGVCRLQRTGPFIPPLTMPGYDIVVTAPLRRELEQSALTGFSFVSVEKTKVVEVPWHEWNPESPDPGEYPEGGEPAEYIDGGEHSPAAAEALGELWALAIPAVGRVERDRPIVESSRELHLVLGTTGGLDFVRSPDVLHTYVSDRARTWLAARVGDWVEFEEASIR